MIKTEDAKKLAFLVVGALLALASKFTFDLYVSNKSAQEVLWAKQFNLLEKSDVCPTEGARTDKLYLFNKSKNLADVVILTENQVTEVGIFPKHTTQIISDDNGVGSVLIKGLKSREYVQLLLCGERYFRPHVVSLSTGNTSFKSSSIEIGIRDTGKENRRFKLIYFGFVFLLFGFYLLNAYILRKKNEKHS